MIVRHIYGHEVDVLICNTPYIRRTLCYDCEQLAIKLKEKQQKLFKEAKNDR